MGDSKEGKRKKDKQSNDDEYHKEKKSKRARTRSRSPGETREDNRRKRRRSRSVSNEKPVKKEKEQDDASKAPEDKPQRPERKNKDMDMLNTRTGGAYIPPARLRLMQAQITDKSSVAFQRLAWEALKKSIHGHINKINVGNIGIIIKDLLKENIVRGRGLLCRSVIQAQAASPTFTNVYAALVAAVNSRFPNIGELLLKRLVIQFKRGFKRNDKAICISSASFIAHLVNQRVAHEILALELLTLLVESPTDDSVEVAIAFLKECGQKLTEVSSKGVNAIFEMLRNILHEGQLDKRVQYMIEVMFQVWKDGFKDHPALIDELELVPEEEQFTHLMMLDEATDAQDILNVFKFDEKYEENEEKYKTLCKEILGSDAESDDEEASGESGSEESEEEEEEGEQKPMTIIDNTETNLVALRRTIYLTINSSLDFEECAHKLMKMQLKPGQEVELCHMFLDCCAEQRTYEKFYGLLAQRFCNINRMYIGPFEEIFKDSYATAHRLDTNRLRNVSKFFAHLLFTDSIGWEILKCVRLNEEDTTSSSRIYIKILFQELAEYMGLKKLNDRLKDPTLQEAFSGIFPRDNPKNTRFSINFFTSIGLGGLTDELREHLKQMPKNVPPLITEINIDSEDSSSSSSDSDSSSSDSDSSNSEEEEEDSTKKKKRDKNKDKEKTPKTPEESADKNERWGHDGFYENYGKDARRHERERDDVFARPRDVAIRKERGNENRRNDHRSRDVERNRESNEEHRRRRDDRDEERSTDRYDSRRRQDDSKDGERDDGRRHENNDNRRRHDDSKDGERDDGRRHENNDSRRRHDESKDGERDDGRRLENNDSRRRHDDSKDGERDDGRRHENNDSRRRHDDSKDGERDGGRRHENNDSRRRHDDSKDGERDDCRRHENKDSRRRHDDSKDGERDDGRRHENRDDSRKIRDDDRERRRNDDRRRDRNNEDSRSRCDDEKSKRDEGKYNREERSRTEEESQRRDESRHQRKDRYEKDKSRKDRSRKDEDNDRYRMREDRSRRDEEKPRREDKSRGDEGRRDGERSRKDEDKTRREERSRDDRSRKSDKRTKDDYTKKSNRKNKQSDSSNSDTESSNSSSSLDEKENRHEKYDARNETDPESEDDSIRKRRKEKRRDSYINEDGWDIRGSSVRREIPATGRYWDNK